MNWLLTPFALKLGVAALIGFGAWWWHSGTIREAKQQQAAETRSEVLNEAEAQHAIEKQKYEERISELETNLMNLATRRAQATQRIEVITKAAETQRNEIPTLSDDAVLLAIRQRLSGTANTAVPTQP